MNKTSNRLSQLGLFILLMRVIMLIFFIFLSLIPFVTAINIILLHYFSNNPAFVIFAEILIIIASIVTIMGIYTLNLNLRGITTIIFSSGLILNFDNPYLLALGIVLCWLFYELWYILERFAQLDKEYSSYTKDSFERQRLSRNLHTQLISFFIIGWITTSLSWIVLYLSTHFYFELGRNFGTLGIATSFTMVTLVYLTKKYVSKPSSQIETNN